VLRGMAVGGVRLQRGAVLSEFRRSASRAVRESDPDAAIRGARATAMARPGVFGSVASGGNWSRRFRGVERAHALIAPLSWYLTESAGVSRPRPRMLSRGDRRGSLAESAEILEASK